MAVDIRRNVLGKATAEVTGKPISVKKKTTVFRKKRTTVVLRRSKAQKEELARLYSSLKNCQGVQVLPYHELAKSKYERFDRPFSMEGVKSPADETIEEFINKMRELGVDAERG